MENWVRRRRHQSFFPAIFSVPKAPKTKIDPPKSGWVPGSWGLPGNPLWGCEFSSSAPEKKASEKLLPPPIKGDAIFWVVGSLGVSKKGACSGWDPRPTKQGWVLFLYFLGGYQKEHQKQENDPKTKFLGVVSNSLIFWANSLIFEQNSLILSKIR